MQIEEKIRRGKKRKTFVFAKTYIGKNGKQNIIIKKEQRIES